MVHFEDDTITDDQADAMALARAFQAASVSDNEKGLGDADVFLFLLDSSHMYLDNTVPRCRLPMFF